MDVAELTPRHVSEPSLDCRWLQYVSQDLRFGHRLAFAIREHEILGCDPRHPLPMGLECGDGVRSERIVRRAAFCVLRGPNVP